MAVAAPKLMKELSDCEKKDVAMDPRGNGVVPVLIMSGLIPCAPWKPSVAVTVRVLKMYRIAHARCPQLAVQSFVKTLCDLYKVRSIFIEVYFCSCINIVDPISTLPTTTIRSVLRPLPRPAKKCRKDGFGEPGAGFVFVAPQACMPTLHV